ncbi:hypothetical protein [Sporolactobacillus nakayamae]|uniref:Uncharacterized protein n=1 Tax=Sporolactobacillus nakayamae TaxID=269670 RepID=A0A1I2PQA1_9BACL|nr:hypothetical protein [Sporolactobacillus nakayamae]SFG16197.1 hypothetical protein SAMN02982927_00844 [Sporolactobacillus nakayamae]
MDRVLKINYWIGIVVAIALLLQSAYGIYHFVHTKQQAQSIQKNFSQSMPNSSNGNAFGNAPSGTNGEPHFGSGGSRGGARPSGGMSAQSNPLSLAVHILTLILSVSALVMTGILGRNNAKKKKELISKEKSTEE